MTRRELGNVSVVVSIYNEEESLLEFWKSLHDIILELKNVFFEIIFVNDGSSDKSSEVIDSIIGNRENSEIEFVVINFSKNFGHESAMIAGIDVSTKKAIVCLDADSQHPPSCIKDMILKYENGFEIVTMIRKKRDDNGLAKNILSKLFYKLLNKLSDHQFDKNASDFFLISKKIAEILKDNFRERNRFLRGYIQTIGFPKTFVHYRAPSRIGGESSYSLYKLFKLSLIAIFSFSNKPLRISMIVSVIFAVFTTSFMGYSLWVFFFGDKPPTGYTTIIMFQSISFTILFLLIGILSLYFGNSLSEIRKRPIYLIEELIKVNEKKDND